MRRSLSAKNALALLLALVTLAAVCAAPAYAAEPGFVNFQPREHSYTEGMFPDVQDDWYAEYVAAAYELGLVQGGADGLFRPDDGVTLAETAALAARIHRTYFTGAADFTQGEPWYQVYVDYCLEHAIVTAEPEDWSAPAKRSEFAAMLSRALPETALPAINAIDDGAIPDVEADAAAAGAIYLLYRAGILTGNDIYGSFLPDSEIRRSEVAAIVSRMAYRSLRRTVELVPKPPYPDLKEGPRQDDDFFVNTAMLGNSLVDGMRLCSGIKEMAYYGNAGATVYSNRLNELVQHQFKAVYIEFGINEIGYEPDKITGSYREVIRQIQAAMPDAEIYVMAITPVTRQTAYNGRFTMTRINRTNEALRAMAEEEHCWYLDCCTLLCNADGYLPDSFAGWDGSPHLDPSGYVAWGELLRTYYAPVKEAE